MLTGGAAKRYAQAVFEIARDARSFDAWQRDLAIMDQLVQDAAGREFFNNPEVSTGQKQQVAESYLANRVQPAALNLARLLIARGRFAAIDRLVVAFTELVRTYQGTAVADVTTAVPLDSAAAADVSRRLGTLIDRRVEVRMHVDPSIIGGIVARVGDYLLDGSVTGQLSRLRARLAQGA